MKKKKRPDPKKNLRIAIIAGIAIVVVVIAFYYNLDQAKLKGEKFGNDLAQVQNSLYNETQYVNTTLAMYEGGKITKSQMLDMMDKHISRMQEIITKYDTLQTPEDFTSTIKLFRLSAEKQLESDKLLKEWVQTGDNATRAESDQLLDQSVQYELSALKSYHDVRTG